jgi:S-adenosylmethionine decarboxylase
MHIAIDGFGADTNKVADVENVRGFLDECCKSLAMKKISEIVVTDYKAPEVNDSGVSGFVMIAESHISVHTFPYRSYVNIDIFSCKKFDVQRALEDIQKYFSLERTKIWEIERGLEYVDTGIYTQPISVKGRDVVLPPQS